MAVVAGLGAAVRAPEGWLMPGGHVDYPVIYVIVEAVLSAAVIIAQIAHEQEELPTIKQDL